jgi:hypothetical protein
MEDARTWFVNRTNPAIIVELIGCAQYRLAELRTPVVIYRRGDNLYVRLESEFHSKFVITSRP